MESSGWHPKILGPADGGPAIAPPDGQSNSQGAAYSAALQACVDKLGGEPPSPPMSPKVAEESWQRQLSTYKCLVGHGYSPDPPPAKETFINQLLSGGTTDWSAYTGMPADPAAHAAATKVCPQPIS